MLMMSCEMKFIGIKYNSTIKNKFCEHVTQRDTRQWLVLVETLINNNINYFKNTRITTTKR